MEGRRPAGALEGPVGAPVGAPEVLARGRRLRGPEEGSLEGGAAGLGEVQGPGDRAQVPTAQEGPLDPSREAPRPGEGAASRAPSPLGASSRGGAASRRPGEASSRQGAGASSPLVGGPSLQEEASSHLDRAPSPAAVVLLVPSRGTEALSDPTLPAAEGPILRAAEGPIHQAAEAIHQAAEGPSLPAAEGPIPAEVPCRTEARLHPAGPAGGGRASVRLLGPSSPELRQANGATELAAKTQTQAEFKRETHR